VLVCVCVDNDEVLTKRASCTLISFHFISLRILRCGNADCCNNSNSSNIIGRPAAISTTPTNKSEAEARRPRLPTNHQQQQQQHHAYQQIRSRSKKKQQQQLQPLHFA